MCLTVRRIYIYIFFQTDDFELDLEHANLG